MRYIPVTGLNPTEKIKKIITNHFGSALISIAEPTTTKGWTIHQIYRQMDKIFKTFREEDGIQDLFLDSGGFQILQGYITKRRLIEYIDTYHILLEKFRDQNMKMFSLDILNKSYTEEEVLKYNHYSINSSIKLLTKYPELKDKQLFIVQSRVPHVLETWKGLIKTHQIFNHYSRYSFGGLVGLKKETNAKFNHFIPMTMWLLAYAKSEGKLENIKHIHMLGQSSRVAIITSVLLEKILENRGIHLEITMDSSEVLRFSPIMDKLPIMFHTGEDYKLARTADDVKKMLENGVLYQADGYQIETAHEMLDRGEIINSDYVELMCQGIHSTVDFAYDFIEKKADMILQDEWMNWTVDDLKSFHEVFKQGRLATEIINNLKHIKVGLDRLDNFEDLHEYTMNVIRGYYE